MSLKVDLFLPQEPVKFEIDAGSLRGVFVCMPRIRDKEPRQKQHSMTKPSNACYSIFLTQTQVVQAGGHVTLRSCNPDGPTIKSCQHLDPSGNSPVAGNRREHIKAERPISCRRTSNPVSLPLVPPQRSLEATDN